MADFSATKRTTSLEDWGEALECMVELNGKSFDITEMEIEAAYEAYSGFEDFWSACKHPFAQDDELKDFSWGIWNACRSAMLQSKYRDLSQPVDPQISEYEKIMLRAGWVMVPVEPTDEMIAAAMNCEDVLFNSDESFCVQYREIYCAMVDTAPALNKGEY